MSLLPFCVRIWKKNEKVYVEVPVGFIEEGKSIKLKKTSYGVRQSLRMFWRYLTKTMLACDVEVLKLDPCLFVGDKVICLCYVDDISFGSSDIAFTNKLAAKLCAKELFLEQEDDTAGFLGVCLHKNGQGLIEMKQTGLIDCDIEILGLDTRISIPPNGFLLSPNHWYVTML